MRVGGGAVAQWSPGSRAAQTRSFCAASILSRRWIYLSSSQQQQHHHLAATSPNRTRGPRSAYSRFVARLARHLSRHRVSSLILVDSRRESSTREREREREREVDGKQHAGVGRRRRVADGSEIQLASGEPAYRRRGFE